MADTKNAAAEQAANENETKQKGLIQVGPGPVKGPAYWKTISPLMAVAVPCSDRDSDEDDVEHNTVNLSCKKYGMLCALAGSSGKCNKVKNTIGKCFDKDGNIVPYTEEE